MRYVVMYESKTGNTRMLAEEIYGALAAQDKELIDLDVTAEVPEADIYFIGFGVHNGSCSRSMLDYFDQITGGRFALFATCGCLPTEQYKSKLEKNLDVWLPENADYLGMLLCQGNVEPDRREIMIGKMPSREKELRQMFEDGSSHPDQGDRDAAADFAARIQGKVEHNGQIPIT